MDGLGATSVRELRLRFDRSLYGLKQAGRLWHKALQILGFVQCMFFKADASNVALVRASVNDVLVTSTSVDRTD